MFKKKKCNKCGEKINENFDFCPTCGNRIKNNEDWGMLGKNDFTEDNSFFETPGFGFLNKMLGNAMKMLEKEMQKEMKRGNEERGLKTNFELYINGKKVNPANIKVTRQPIRQITNEKRKIIKKEFSEDKIKKLSKLPRKEPSTNIKRFSDKIIYEIDVPGVKSIEDVSIVPLENSIEIKAIGKDKVYSKLIPMNLPIINYKLEKAKLILELENKI